MTLVLEIPRVPMSLNEMLSNGWRHRHRATKVWRQEIALAVYQHADRPKEPFQKARVVIERRSRGRMDPDNLAGSMKPVIDALRHARVLVDDSPEHIELTVTQRQSFRDPPRTLIEIQPLPATT